jgi:hypothetical protein
LGLTQPAASRAVQRGESLAREHDYSLDEIKKGIKSLPSPYHTQGSDKVLRYLGRYVHRIAITNNRILTCDNDQVTFRYKQSRSRKKESQGLWRTMSLPAEQFMARFLQHVPPRRFHKVRYYGLWSPATGNC